MKAISIRQPWAWCIIHAGKDIENRSWPAKHRGPILVHASKGMSREEYEDCLAFVHQISERNPFPPGLAMPAMHELPRGGIIGQVEIGDCVTESTSPWFFGPFGFVLKNAKPLPFRPLTGCLGMFDVPHEEVFDAPTKEEIEAAKTPSGGWTRETLAAWGVPWPPPKGWKKRLETASGQRHDAAAILPHPKP